MLFSPFSSTPGADSLTQRQQDITPDPASMQMTRARFGGYEDSLSYGEGAGRSAPAVPEADETLIRAQSSVGSIGSADGLTESAPAWDADQPIRATALTAAAKTMLSPGSNNSLGADRMNLAWAQSEPEAVVGTDSGGESPVEKPLPWYLRTSLLVGLAAVAAVTAAGGLTYTLTDDAKPLSPSQNSSVRGVAPVPENGHPLAPDGALEQQPAQIGGGNGGAPAQLPTGPGAQPPIGNPPGANPVALPAPPPMNPVPPVGVVPPPVVVGPVPVVVPPPVVIDPVPPPVV